ncbi:hypothetical protein [Rubritalea tangerina]|uniref:hypothetical protein n=1 Tax=Rubritalea tangerina TaxID=430798 RepID=UPI003613F804
MAHTITNRCYRLSVSFRCWMRMLRAQKEYFKYREVYQEWRGKLDELESLQKSEQANEQEIDLLRFRSMNSVCGSSTRGGR